MAAFGAPSRIEGFSAVDKVLWILLQGSFWLGFRMLFRF